MRFLPFFGLCLIIAKAESKEIDLHHVKCLVCRETMNELENAVLKANPNKLIDVGNFRMDAEGNTIHKKIPLSQSETHITILLDHICDKLTDYVRATRKSDNQLVIFNLMDPSGGMNPMMSEVDVIQDGDLNKSLEYYCRDIVNEFEEDIVSLYVDKISNKKKVLCTEISRLCENYTDNQDNDDDDDDVDNYDSNFYGDKDEL
ncbi:hypothetical protein PUN28_008704 [Cardiocondyla obscurior]|uniref:Saposin B-type domain-containing protein n=1 Tax=Cardiocondyla obscurior TaxID=286306 RepID=A0AAW2G436_9HYME